MNLNSTQKNALSNFKKFVSFRNKISLYLSLIVLICYYIFILGVGLTPEILGYKLGPSAITLGIMAGVGLIVLCIISTGIYTFIANYFLDKEQEEVLKNLEKEGLIDALQNGKISYKEIL
ncbi:DUF485 domain-containing protein [Campylobacter upsaliensis]|uniref:DUF485 domain-containing protein n=2 Tax=Campylobacter upsaliensis TaxID=28080 RepID=A0A3X8R3G3_CAMUP|nr:MULTISPECIES: DUF485 domain-containing protein [Campylobacter]EAB5281230.1 DUF485 domain-containing protein [Campylobacter upsaliensis]EAH4719365.1 DUF485 domain-containing protein [Campylobacter upsaliensis]EAH5199657.1 DUF485 domain-containing protein [Campylobacter upsaliensis]EAH5545849.1 DUF485 domain-containing protein [Campylobacter upsaliensis]EAH5676000.1 DUF485 domain-containing protein [Campylobacter upsaliensis]